MVPLCCYKSAFSVIWCLKCVLQLMISQLCKFGKDTEREVNEGCIFTQQPHKVPEDTGVNNEMCWD